MWLGWSVRVAVVMAVAMVVAMIVGMVARVAGVAVGKRIHGKMLYYYISPCPLKKQWNFVPDDGARRVRAPWRRRPPETGTALKPRPGTRQTAPAWAKDRLLFLCWEDRGDEWLLVEDEETTQRSREDAAVAQSTRK